MRDQHRNEHDPRRDAARALGDLPDAMPSGDDAERVRGGGIDTSPNGPEGTTVAGPVKTGDVTIKRPY